MIQNVDKQNVELTKWELKCTKCQILQNGEITKRSNLKLNFF